MPFFVSLLIEVTSCRPIYDAYVNPSAYALQVSPYTHFPQLSYLICYPSHPMHPFYKGNPVHPFVPQSYPIHLCYPCQPTIPMSRLQSLPPHQCAQRRVIYLISRVSVES